jgi:hypothetical protein
MIFLYAMGPRAIVPLVAAPLPRVFTPLVFTSIGWLQHSTLYTVGVVGITVTFGPLFLPFMVHLLSYHCENVAYLTDGTNSNHRKNQSPFLRKFSKVWSGVTQRLWVVHRELAKAQLGLIWVPAFRARLDVGGLAFDNQISQLAQLAREPAHVAYRQRSFSRSKRIGHTYLVP